MNPHIERKLAMAVSNRYFRRIRCVAKHRTARDLRRVRYWEGVIVKWTLRAMRDIAVREIKFQRAITFARRLS